MLNLYSMSLTEQTKLEQALATRMVTVFQPSLLDGNDYSPDVFEGMILDFVFKQCNGVATIQSIRAKFVHNPCLDKTIRKLRMEKRIISAKTFGPNGNIVHCYKIPKAPLLR